jgi:hypothetical protein
VHTRAQHAWALNTLEHCSTGTHISDAQRIGTHCDANIHSQATSDCSQSKRRHAAMCTLACRLKRQWCAAVLGGSMPHSL